MRISTRKFTAAVGLAGVGALSAVLGATPATAAPSSVAPTQLDSAFVASNEQSNLAEISLGTLATAKGQDAATKALAAKTHADHVTAKAKLTAVAKSAGLTLPTSLTAVSTSIAAQLKAAAPASFDLMYAQAQVTGHEQALTAARNEQASTKNAALKSYAGYYIGVATMHLHMAQAEVTALGGSATQVAAGSGGGAATNSTGDNTAAEIGIGAGGMLLVIGTSMVLRRRRTDISA